MSIKAKTAEKATKTAEKATKTAAKPGFFYENVKMSDGTTQKVKTFVTEDHHGNLHVIGTRKMPKQREKTQQQREKTQPKTEKTSKMEGIMQLANFASDILEEVPAAVVAAGVIGGIIGAGLSSFFGKK